MNKVEIKADGPVEVTVNGEPWSDPYKVMTVKPVDRITVDMTEREAELVYHLTHSHAATGMTQLFDTLWRLRISRLPASPFKGRAESNGRYRTGYAHAERIDTSREVKRSYHADSYSHGPTVTVALGTGIRLTMDRDVAVTLRSLMKRLDCYGELDELNKRLYDMGVLLRGPRFTGTIRWKKKRLKTTDCKPGHTYKFIGATGNGPANYEWEEA